ncbi:hypothetical protein D0T84_19335 [Dysgonomonas sp. 521]|uniref:hypothetical protein n=1 Tax=Dysgonomonas sp. 521 TaxID=2302932 RepID=UPI0013D702D4|nr:hypothetical protein [Dysgonomonas sp. 521]NDV97042.1 hypothetical protein [Dysgonomonas sp. 521]
MKKIFILSFLTLFFCLTSYSQSCYTILDNSVFRASDNETKPYATGFPKKGLEYEYQINLSQSMQQLIISVEGGTIDGKTTIGFTGITPRIITFKIKWDKEAIGQPKIKLEGIACNYRQGKEITFISWQDDVPICTSCPK